MSHSRTYKHLQQTSEDGNYSCEQRFTTTPGHLPLLLYFLQGKAAMAFVSTLRGASCSCAALRRPPAVLCMSILLVLVCLQANGTPANLQKDIEVLESMAHSMKEAYITRRDKLVARFEDNSRTLDALQNQMLETKKHFEAVKKRHFEDEAEALKSFEDFNRKWEEAENKIQTAKNMARLVEELHKEL